MLFLATAENELRLLQTISMALIRSDLKSNNSLPFVDIQVAGT
jgi:hypothetical protein